MRYSHAVHEKHSVTHLGPEGAHGQGRLIEPEHPGNLAVNEHGYVDGGG